MLWSGCGWLEFGGKPVGGSLCDAKAKERESVSFAEHRGRWIGARLKRVERKSNSQVDLCDEMGCEGKGQQLLFVGRHTRPAAGDER